MHLFYFFLNRLKHTCLIFVGLALFSCSSSDDELGELNLPSREVGVVEQASFNIKILPNPDANPFESFWHAIADRESGCSIPRNTLSNMHKQCIVEVEELDIFVNGLAIQYNVPREMCEYFVLQTYWFYLYETGLFRGTVELHVNVDAEGVSNTACANCAELPEVDFVDETVRCVYDHTANGGPNCCLGEYYLRTTRFTKDDEGGGETVVTTETVPWGGSFKECISGPGAGRRLVRRGNFQIPADEIFYVRDAGANDVVTVDAPLAVQERETYAPGGTVFATNYYNAEDHNEGVPTAIRPGSDRAGRSCAEDARPCNGDASHTGPETDTSRGDPLPSGNTHYRYLCLDRGGEVRHVISVAVREWNTDEKFQEYINFQASPSVIRSGVTPEPDIDGVEGRDCLYEEFDLDSRHTGCNDYPDWKDWLEGYPGSFDSI